MRVRNFLSCLLLMLICWAGFAETITLKEFLDLAQENHPLFKKEALSAEIEEKRAESLLGTRDWLASIAPYYNHLGEVSAQSYGGADKVDSFGLEAGLSKSIWATGGSLGLSVLSGYSRSEFPGPGASKAYTHGIGLSYTQPLLQNLGGKLDRLGYELSSYTVNLTEVQALENSEAFILELAVSFLDWVQIQEEIKVAEERLKLAKEQLEQVQKRYGSNLADRVDVLRGEDAVRTAEQGLLQLNSLWRARQAELAVMSQSGELYEKSPVFDLYKLKELPGVEEALLELKKQSRLLKIFNILKEKLVFQLEGLIEQKRPQLNLNLSGSLYGSDTEIEKSFEISKPDASVSLEFSAPLGNSGIKSKIEKVDLQIEKLQEEKRDIEITLEAALRNLLIQIVDMEEILKLNQAQIESSQEKTREELKMYNQGRGQLTFVIQSRDNEQNARLGHVNNAALYHTLLLQYQALMDELFPTR
ncbi:MAG: hypothetical protein GH155_01025 [Spirochaeta sp.]|nr:hypothetical protein [Spirochaeta sp.]